MKPQMKFQHVNAGHYIDSTQLSRRYPEGWLYVGRGVMRKGLVRSPLANPYTSRKGANAQYVGSKKKAVAMYRKWLWAEIQKGTPDVIAHLKKVEDHTVLVCHCNGPVCHSYVVRKAAKWLEKNPFIK